VTGGQFALLFGAALVAAILAIVLWEKKTYWPVVANRLQEPKLFWSAVSAHVAMILICIILAFVNT
jgi:hypothetical protein